jgi:hypothetical protein
VQSEPHEKLNASNNHYRCQARLKLPTPLTPLNAYLGKAKRADLGALISNSSVQGALQAEYSP